MAKPGEMGIINVLWRCQVWPQPLQHLPPSSPQSLSLPQGHMKGSLCPDDSTCPPCAVPACRVMNKGPANPLPHPQCCFPRLQGAAWAGRSCPQYPHQLSTPGVPSAPHLQVLTVAVPHGSLPSLPCPSWTLTTHRHLLAPCSRLAGVSHASLPHPA